MSKAIDVIRLLEDESDTTKLASDIESIVKGVFPNSYVNADFKSNLYPSIIVKFTLGSGKDEWENGIIQNDPAYTIFMVDGMDKDGSINKLLTLEKSHGSIFVKPTNPHMAYDSIKVTFRKVTGDQAAILKGVKNYFERLKKTLQDNRDRMTDRHIKVVGNKF